jgi:4-amino-4-deoxy-L-arabinose transferase-like glycosyltransferase
LRRTQVLVAAGLGLIVLLGAFLRFYKLGAYSIGNAYYAATVKSMLTSWHNFFFAAYEPGGSVTVDKPPLGFWLQAAPAYFLGVNGFALALPQALAGTLSIPLLYALVRRPFGRGAGLAAALALAVLPVAVSTERNNTIDGLLVFVLLLAAWAFLRAVRTGRLRDLLLGAVLVGIGFNTKMLQAFLPLPAFYLLYLLGARLPWGRRLLYLAVATAVLLAVSLSWAVAVDLTPADERPYIGSSEDNTVMELIVGHNGLKRLNLSQFFDGGDDGGGGAAVGLPDGAPSGGLPAGARSRQGGPPPGDGSARPGAGMVAGGPGAPPDGVQGNPPGGGPGPVDGQAPPDGQGPPGGGLGGGPGGGGSSEVGEPGWLRLFTEPLAGEASWLLPLALLGLPLTLWVLGRPWPLTGRHLALVLWAGWLLPELVYFSLNSGLFHGYYLIMLGPPLAALAGAAVWALWRLVRRRPLLGWLAAALAATVTLAVQGVTLASYADYAAIVFALAIPLLVVGLGLLLLAGRRQRRGLRTAAFVALLLSLVVAPLLWSGLTAVHASPDVALPRAGPDSGSRGRTASAALLSPQQEVVLDYLLAHTDPDDYLVAGESSHDVSGYILATGRPALTFGGFNGGDDVIDAEGLAEMVAGGELRYVLGGDLARKKPEIGRWLAANCAVVQVPGAGGAWLYDCGGW